MIKIHIEHEGRSVEAESRITVGRDASCDIQLDDSMASRLHCVIQRQGRQWSVEDQESSNGTFLGDDEHPIRSAILRPGDVVVIGNARLRVEFDETLPFPADEDALRIRIVEPAHLAREVVCARDSVTIGRHPSSDVFIDDPTVSRLHAVVARTSAGYVLNDQQATNAVYIGDPPEPATAAVLYDGMVIRLGAVRLEVSVPSALPARPEPPAIRPETASVHIADERPSAEVVQARLVKAPLFQGFDAEDWQLLLSAYERNDGMDVVVYQEGDVVCEAQRFDLNFRVVLYGEIAATDPKSGETIISHRRGDFFGLTEAKRSLPRAMRHVAKRETRVLEMPRQHIRYIERNAGARALVSERHKEESWRVMAAQLGLLQGVPPHLIAQLIEHSVIEFHDKAGITLVKQGDPGDFMAIVRDGFVKVIDETNDDRILGYLRAGDVFGEIALLEDTTRTASVVTAGKAEIVKILRDDFRALCFRHPEVADRLRVNYREREERADPELADILHKFGQGYIQADALLVMDLELCVKCDLCVDACEDLHGVSRLQRRGMQIGKHLAPSACRHCDDPVCMFSCPTGAIKRRPEGEIYIDYDLCTGVGACALACPYDNIQMVDTQIFDNAQARKQRAHPSHDFFRPYPDEPAPPGLLQRLLGMGRSGAGSGDEEDQAMGGEIATDGHSVPKSYPIKCDLCDGLPFMGCVHACPTGAALRVDPRTLLESHEVVASGSVIGKAGRGREG